MESIPDGSPPLRQDRMGSRRMEPRVRIPLGLLRAPSFLAMEVARVRSTWPLHARSVPPCRVWSTCKDASIIYSDPKSPPLESTQNRDSLLLREMSNHPPGSSYPYAGGYAGPPPAQPYPAGGGYGHPQPSYDGYGGTAPPSAPYPAPTGGEKPPKAQQGGYGYGYEASAPYAAPAGGEKPPKAQQGGYGYGYEASAPYAAPTGGEKPPKAQQGGYGYGYEASAPPAPYGSYGGAGMFSSLVPAAPASAFPPGTDPNVVACFQAADQDGSGFIDDKELQRALSSYNESFSLRTVRLLMYLFTSSNERKIGPKDFTSVFYSLQNWRAIFERFDRDRSGKIDTTELRDALLSLGLAVSPTVLNLLVSKFDKTGGRNNAIEYDHFIELPYC